MLHSDSNIGDVILKNSSRNVIEIVRGGQPYFDLLLKLINNAYENIHLQAYIFTDDETGNIIGEALKASAKRGVKVYVLVDGYASQSLSNKFIADLKESGIHFRFFEPFFKSSHFYFGRRLHHKIFVVDTKYSLVGGINISNRYNDISGIPAWLDYAIYLEGELAKDLCVLCWKTWNGFPANMGITACELKELKFDFEGIESSLVGMRRNDWVRRKNEISASYISMFKNAQSHIIILCSYFLPGKIIRKTLRDASKRGVKISIITAGPSDVLVSKFAERWLYDWLLRNKIDLYEYQPNIVHAKVAVCDSQWFTLGSYNINDISAYASIELNLEVHNKIKATQLNQSLITIINNDCLAITTEELKHTKNIFKQLIYWASYKIIRGIFYVITFYYKQWN